MKYCDCFRKRIGCSNPQEVFDYLMKTLKKSITCWDYFVNWAKVHGQIASIEMDLNLLNYLVGKENIEEEFLNLVQRYPAVKKLLPILVACRKNRFEVLTGWERGDFQYDSFFLDEHTDPQKALVFAQSTKFLELLKTKRLKSVVDYVMGVEVGLDSNARKNRVGDAMEAVVEGFVKKICSQENLPYITQATADLVRRTWGLTLPVDKSNRTIDFVIQNQGRLFLIETNFYTGGGSKLKATAGEYKSMFDFWKSAGCSFLWITDGKGWKTSRNSLEETFSHIDYTLNLDMVAKGLLEDVMVHTCRK